MNPKPTKKHRDPSTKTLGRYLLGIGIIVLCFLAVLGKMYQIGVLQNAEYTYAAESKSTKTITLTGKRGAIYDCNMTPIAYDKRSYDVQFYRDPSAATSADRAAYTRSIVELIKIVESNGKKTIDTFWLRRDENDQWIFDTGARTEAAAAKRESQWRGNFFLRNTKTEDLFDTLCRNYSIPSDLDEAFKIKVLSIWQESRMYNYLSKPVTVAYGVDFETVSEIEARSEELLGVSIAESYARIYPMKASAAHSIGYTAKISGEETMKEYLERGYPNDALVGQTGIEYSLEDQLTPYGENKQGQRVVEVNNLGKIIREISYEAPTDGNSVVLTIDMGLQKIAEAALDWNIGIIRSEQEATMRSEKWQRTNRELRMEYAERNQQILTAQTGAIVALDPNSGRVLALANSPSYDLSMFTDGVDATEWRELLSDPRNPMYNRAISARDTPGSIFKLAVALGALMEGKLTLDETISDMSPFTGTDSSYQPSCWIGRANRWKHADQTVVEGLKNSCNYFFFEIGSRMGSDAIVKWAAQLGLTSRTSIELANETMSFVGDQSKLYTSSRAIDDQYTSKPYYASFMIKKNLRAIAEDLGTSYDEDKLDDIARKLCNLVEMEGTKNDWLPHIRRILMEDAGLDPQYIANHLLVNEFFYCISDLRWTLNETIMAAIGQSITQVTPIAVARYVAAIANDGIVYNCQLVDKIISPTGEVLLEKQPVIANRITGAGAYIAAIQEGMAEVTSVENDGTAASYFATAKYKIAAKTGTAQRTDMDIENNAWLVTYAPVDDPRIVVVVYIQNGYAGARASRAAIKIIEYYLDKLYAQETTTISNANFLAE
ncbi:MAG: penicillin-binding transpeptidase domain-containing protein [Christensenellales bacterium]|jgi:penicillin-binding protein 2